MELKDIEQKIKDIVKIVELCPASLQEKCFEMLLNAYVLGTIPAPRKQEVKQPKEDAGDTGAESEEKDIPDTGKTDEPEIKLSDIHVKARKFLEKGISIEQINNIFYKDGDDYKPLFDHLKTSKIGESQVRITLLEALKNGLKTGEFSADTKTVRDLCEAYKCYDLSNFAGNFKKAAEMFNEEYKKDITLSLSAKGKEKLADVIKDLAA